MKRKLTICSERKTSKIKTQESVGKMPRTQFVEKNIKIWHIEQCKMPFSVGLVRMCTLVILMHVKHMHTNNFSVVNMWYFRCALLQFSDDCFAFVSRGEVFVCRAVPCSPVCYKLLIATQAEYRWFQLRVKIMSIFKCASCDFLAALYLKCRGKIPELFSIYFRRPVTSFTCTWRLTVRETLGSFSRLIYYITKRPMLYHMPAQVCKDYYDSFVPHTYEFNINCCNNAKCSRMSNISIWIR